MLLFQVTIAAAAEQAPALAEGMDWYTRLWVALIAYTFHGFFGYVLAIMCMTLGFWFGARRQNFVMAAVFFLCAATVVFGAGFMRFF
jgi:hypothetical protein